MFSTIYSIRKKDTKKQNGEWVEMKEEKFGNDSKQGSTVFLHLPQQISQATDSPEMDYMRHAHTKHSVGVGLSNESMSQGRQVRSSTSYREPKITKWSRYFMPAEWLKLEYFPPWANDKSKALELYTIYVNALYLVFSHWPSPWCPSLVPICLSAWCVSKMLAHCRCLQEQV